jgi:hypothetical protein
MYNSYNFIGPSSVTLHQRNIITPNTNVKAPNIRENYTVTEKTDGERCLLFVSKRIYFINNRMEVTFTGRETSKKGKTIIDGEYVRFDKNGDLLNSYYAFDIYFLNGVDIRENEFFTGVFGVMISQCRLGDLEEFMLDLHVSLKPERRGCVFSAKKFYQRTRGEDIFSSCNEI